jgi:hypothetical protein
MTANERIFNIILESSKTTKAATTKTECNEECRGFQDTIGNNSNFDDTIPTTKDFKLTVDGIPIWKTECGKGECCKEAYMVDGRILDIYMADNGIENDADAVYKICEHYGIDPSDMVVVIESDEINKGLIDHAKTYIDCGLLRRCHDQLRNLLNAGLRVAKK